MLVSDTLGKVMLIDDSKIDNFVNSKVLELSEKAEEVLVFDDANQALQLLNTPECVPNFIFLDIYMPLMNGFDFLEDYAKIRNKNTKLFLLSSAYDNLELNKLKKYNWISGYIVKPLTYEAIDSLFA